MSIPIDKFCDPEKPRVRCPWVAGGNVYATDGRILVICEPSALDRVPENDPELGPPRADAVMKPFLYIRRWQSLPPFPSCETCDDTGVVECPTCHGAGTRLCPHCKSDLPCPRCKTGVTRCSCVVEIGDRLFVRELANLLLLLPDCEWGAKTGSGPSDPLFLRFRGGRGAVMPWENG